MVSKLWSESSNRTITNLLRKHVTPQVDDVPSVLDEQPCNPYNEIYVLSGHQDIVNNLVLIDDIRIASSGYDNLVFIWNVEIGVKIHCLQGHLRPVTSMLVHQQRNVRDQENIQVLITASSDKTIRIWHCDDGTCLNEIQDHHSTVKCLVKIKPDFLFCSGGESLCLWNDQGEILSDLKQPSQDADIQFILPIINDRLVIAFSKPLLVIYAINTSVPEKKSLSFYRDLPPHREDIRCLVNISEESFASASLDGEIVIWSSVHFTALHTLNKTTDFEGVGHGYPYSIQHMMVIDQKYLLACVGNGFILYDTTSGKSLAAKANAHYSKVSHVQLLVNSVRCLLATSSQDGTVRLWGCDNPKTTPCAGEQSSIEIFLGKSITGKRDSTMEPELLGECCGHSGSIQMICGFQDGFASCASDGLIILWKDGDYQRQKRIEMVTNSLLSP